VTSLIIEMPDDLARTLENMAAVQQKTVQEIAIQRLRSLVEPDPGLRPGSPSALLRAMLDAPHPSAADVDDLDAAIAAARIPPQTRDLFVDEPEP
jgi:hypothetical protein